MTSAGLPDLVLHPSGTIAHGLLCEAGSRASPSSMGLSLLSPGVLELPSVASGMWFPAPRANPCLNRTSQQSRRVLLQGRNSSGAAAP